MELPHTLRGAERAFVERLVDRCRGDDRVAALFLGGSHADGSADEHADVDLYLVTTDDGFDGVRDDRRALMRGLGDVVFLEEHDDFGFLMLLFMYADGAHGEIALTPESEVAQVHAGAYRTLVDRTGVLRDRVFPRWRLDPDERGELVRRRLIWFWYDRRLLDVALARGRLWTAHHYLERCRRVCVDLARLAERPDEWPGGYEKVEASADPGTLDRLAPTVVGLDAAAMSQAADLLTTIYRELGHRVADEHGVDYPARVDDLVRRGSRPRGHPPR